MSEADVRRVAERVLNLYLAVVAISIVGILALVAYSIKLGPLTGPGVEESFGLALALMFLFSALLLHVLDRTYRVWPLGRRVAPEFPGPVSEAGYALFLKVIVVAAAGIGIAYVLGTLISP